MHAMCDVSGLHLGQFLWHREDGYGCEEAVLGGMLDLTRSNEAQR